MVAFIADMIDIPSLLGTISPLAQSPHEFQPFPTRFHYAMPSHRLIGNVLHAALLGAISAYAAAVLFLLRGVPSVASSHFDDRWLATGFCAPHDDDDSSQWTTHDRSALLMTILSILGLGIVHMLRDQLSTRGDDAADMVTWALLGALGHAAGHAILASSDRAGLLPLPSGDVSAMDEFLADDANWTTFVKHVPGYLFFWIPLVNTYMRNMSRNRVAGFAFIAMVGAMQIPLKLGFSYTLIVLFAGQSIDQLLLAEDRKGFEYMLWPMVTLLPNFLISVMESTVCSGNSFFAKHGHLVFDGYMALSYSVYYVICWMRNNTLT